MCVCVCVCVGVCVGNYIYIHVHVVPIILQSTEHYALCLIMLNIKIDFISAATFRNECKTKWYTHIKCIRR